ncbi:type II toxin-antitoxin system RelE family toxin [Halorientalis marina]|uniref:type II toxin-antitoxin system RelE family toxin n=1 Tax=Halorientalis marina TaxID=2931976 RepID=UPI001FF48A74|nr:hypothetical protein [Halorientalis marina]
MSEKWDWELTDTADRQFDDLDEYAQVRISSKLDEVVTDQWRDPMDYPEPLEGAPHQKLQIGPFRLGCRAARSEQVLYVLTITKRGGDAYRGDDWTQIHSRPVRSPIPTTSVGTLVPHEKGGILSLSEDRFQFHR